MCGLQSQGTFVEDIAEDSEGEDGECEAIAAVERLASCELRKCFIVVFASRGDVPEGWVEDYARCGDWRYLLADVV